MKMQEKQFRIGELAKLIGVERFVIRFWEKEFGIQSHRSVGGQRFYIKKDVDTFKTIRHLLHEEGFTIAGAKQQLAQKMTHIKPSHIINMDQQQTIVVPVEALKIIRRELSALKNNM
jgi:DNA-binding transcriptional MerR regulator